MRLIIYLINNIMKNKISTTDIMYSLIEKSNYTKFNKKFYKNLEKKIKSNSRNKPTVKAIFFNYKTFIAIGVLVIIIGSVKNPTYAKEIIANVQKCGVNISCWKNDYGMNITGERTGNA